MNVSDVSRPITGTLTAIVANPWISGRDALPGRSPAFRASQGLAVWLTLDGSLAPGSAPAPIDATVQVLKSVDEGKTWRPMTLFGDDAYIFTRRMCEPVVAEDSDGAFYCIAATALGAPVTYRLGHG